jgi:hypothetical protein
MNFLALALVCGALASLCTGVGIKLADAQSAHIEELVEERGPSSKLELKPAQRNAIYQEVHKGTRKVAPSPFASDVGAEVPPVTDLTRSRITSSPPTQKRNPTSSPRWMIRS